VYPVLFRLGGYAVEANGVVYLLAIVAAWAYAVRVARRHGWERYDVLPGLLLTVLAAYLGARLHGALLQGQFTGSSLGELLAPRGLSFFGGLLTGSVAVLGYLRWRRIPVATGADALTPLAPVLYALFRLGCLFNGDDYGRATSAPWGMRFPEGSPPTFERVHPTQLYEILFMAPVFGWLWRRRQAHLPPGALTFELCMLMGLERFLVEFWRLGQPVAAGLTAAQWLALLLLLLGAAGRFLLTARRTLPA
jgi:phosphatidylglycerol:prolipoprotein diacylglycerol transferase